MLRFPTAGHARGHSSRHTPGAASRARGVPASNSLRVFVYTAPACWEHPGGGEVQLLKTAGALRRLGVDARLFDPCEDSLDQADWLHLFGTRPDCLTMARRAKRAGVRIALSPISWYDPRACWSLERGLFRKVRGVSAWVARRTWSGLPSWRRELIHAADLLLPNSAAEAEQLEQLFGADPDRITVVPNGVDARFADASPAMFESRFKVRDFVLVPSRIEPRKNQLAVLRALWGAGVSTVVLGDPHPDHADYYNKCLREADAGVRFVGRLDHDSPMLASAYAAARVVVLASWFETPGLAALEGALAGAEVVVTARGSAREYFGDLVRYVEPRDLAGIRAAVREAMLRPRREELRAIVRARFLWDAVAAHTLRAYDPAAAAATVCREHVAAAA